MWSLRSLRCFCWASTFAFSASSLRTVNEQLGQIEVSKYDILFPFPVLDRHVLVGFLALVEGIAGRQEVSARICRMTSRKESKTAPHPAADPPERTDPVSPSAILLAERAKVRF